MAQKVNSNTQMLPQQEETRQRDFQFGKTEVIQQQLFEQNFIRTSKYTVITFLPKCLLLQFKRYANIYFLIIAILQTIPEISPLNPIASWAPLIFVISLSMLREGLEDRQRHKSDVEMNSTKCQVYRNGNINQVTWADVLVGDILYAEENEALSADVILLTSSLENGICFIETSSLDGEKNLKPKSAMAETVALFDNNRPIQKLDGRVSCILPNANLYQFEGTIYQNDKKLIVGSKQFLLRGSKLKNTKWIIGIVCYTGKETKIMQNSDQSKYKTSNIEVSVNKMILQILIFQFVISFISGLGSGIWVNINLEKHTYLPPGYNPALEGFLSFLTYIVLNNTMIPISLIVSLEIVKYVQAYLIMNDEDMFNIEKQRGPKVFTSSINEELGQIQYVFSDKTGTLTSNKMEFKISVIGNQMFGETNIISDKPSAIQKEVQLQVNCKDNQQRKISYHNCDINLINLVTDQNIKPLEKPFQIYNKTLDRELLQFSNYNQLAREYMLVLSSCHECIVEEKENTTSEVRIEKSDEQIKYQGPSPDEITLVDQAKQYGFVFKKSSQSKQIIDIFKVPVTVDLLNLFEFDSNRKRMSVIVRHEGRIKLLIKGADNVIKERLNKKLENPFSKSIFDSVDQFSKKGLRTLLIAMKIIEDNEYEEFNKEYQKISSMADKEKAIATLAESIETNLYLIGATAVEDKLQENVPETIRDLLLAKIQVWMLTGDKMETAENIARSCKLIQPQFKTIKFTVPRPIKDKPPTQNAMVKQLSDCIYLVLKAKRQSREKAFLIEGEDLGIILENDEQKNLLIQVVQDCEAVVCCRATPNQKAQVVRLVKDKLNKITLAIGDGANDVNMIQEAHIGIGLYGQEGMRAVQASDYALPEFQGLWRLVLVHGRWSYLRISEMILYFFYKNFIFTIPQFFYCFVNGFSGQTIFDDWYITLFNILFTALPLVIRAITEQDVYYKVPQQDQNNYPISIKEKPTIKKVYPKLYYTGQQNLIFTQTNFFSWMFQALIDAILIFIVHIYVMHQNAYDIDGHNPDLWVFSISLYTSVILIVDLKLVIYTQYCTTLSVLVMIFTSLGVYIAYIFISSEIQQFAVYQSSLALFSTPNFYFCLFFTCGIIYAVDSAILFVYQVDKKGLIEHIKDIIRFQKYNDDSLMQRLQMVDTSREHGREIPQEVINQRKKYSEFETNQSLTDNK